MSTSKDKIIGGTSRLISSVFETEQIFLFLNIYKSLYTKQSCLRGATGLGHRRKNKKKPYLKFSTQADKL
jgi:hypothetical protein